MNPDLLKLILPERSCRGNMPCRNADSDRSIILPIVILLIADKCDFFLIFSLLYILL